MIPRCFILLSLLSLTALADAPLNIADSAKHPYADPAQGRDGIRFSDHRVNSQRIYDFYSRQADYYMARRETPSLLPAFPGLDAGKFGHWGKYSQNQYVDNQWNKMDLGPVQSHWLKFNNAEYHPAVSSRIGEDQQMTVHFDPDTATYPTVWTGGFLNFNGARWGMHSPAAPRGDVLFENQRVADKINRRPPPALNLPHKVTYKGHHRFGKTVVHSYTLDGIAVKDRPWAENNIFYRTIEWDRGATLRMMICSAPEGAQAVTRKGSLTYTKTGETVGIAVHSDDKKTSATLEEADGLVWAVLKSEQSSSARIHLWKGKPSEADAALSQSPKAKLPSRPVALYKEPLSTPTTIAKNTAAYVVDDVTVPFQNPWRSRMFLSSMAFFPNGDALIATLMGELWLVKGLHGEMGAVTWRRYATGLEQPLGIVIDKDAVFVLCRTQIARIHDQNNDGEADFIERHTPLTYSYPCMAGLFLDPAGYFWFVNGKGAFRTPRNKSKDPELVADGFRNALASGMDPQGNFYVGPQEGILTPASFVAECKPGQFYGFNSRRFKTDPINIPMVYVPRGVDNSTGGFVVNPDPRFGPLANTLVGLSFGNSRLYSILRDRQNPRRTQGAVVPLNGMTASGVCRGAVSPIDGQLYVVGINGWGDYATADGCLHRYRYTGAPYEKPTDFSIHSNGLRIQFATALDKKTVEETANYFAQKWGYEYSMAYGCREHSTEQPTEPGHDRVTISQVRLLADNKSIFVEIPDLKPAMVQHLRMHLRSAKGKDFKTDLFATIGELPTPFAFDGQTQLVAGKPQKLTLRVNASVGKFHNPEKIGTVKVDKTYQLDAIPGLAYSTASIKAKAGSRIGIRFTNTDQMPHNLVIIAPGTYVAVGTASEKMVANPGAANKNYVPDSADVIAQTPMVLPEAEYDLIFTVPSEPGRYPYLCTFPGHWRLMKGELIVEPEN